MFAAKKKPKRSISRARALAGRPERVPTVREEECEDGRLKVTVQFERSPWLQRLSGSARFERTFRLDPFGREVYAACDGKTEVSAIIGRFAHAHRIGSTEAEMSVTAFLKTLMAKGLVAMAVEKGRQ
ncbi:MAG: PqqD family protein [Kiritimatiellae bacterium]|nr:PqqD family protein [Kiritimatiellia bacterium]